MKLKTPRGVDDMLDGLYTAILDKTPGGRIDIHTALRRAFIAGEKYGRDRLTQDVKELLKE